MVNIQVRDVPERVRDTLAAAASARGQSMQVYVRNLLEEDAQRAQNVRMLRDLSEIGGGYVSNSSRAADEIASIRAERDARNTGAS